MWIEQIEIEGFRRLSGSYSLSPSLTVVVGDNEAGKSTLQDALVRALFGFSRSERRKARGVSELERRRPWDGSQYRLVAQLRDDDERSLRVEWDFSRPRVKLFDDLGGDLLEAIRGADDGEGLGELLLDIGIDDFRAVCCIDQGDLAAVRQSPSLTVALQEAVVNAAGDVSVEEATSALNEFLRSVGARTDTLRPTPTGRLTAAMRQRERLRAEIGTADETRAELVGVAAQLAQADQERGQLAAEEEAARQALLRVELDAAEGRLREAEGHTRAAADRPADSPRIPDEVRVDVGSLEKRVSELETALIEARGETLSVEADATRVETDVRELAAAVDELEPYANVDPSARDEVQSALGQLDALAGGILDTAPAVPEPDPTLARYRRERSRLESLSAPVSTRPVLRALWVVLVVLTLGIAWGVRRLVHRLRRPTPTELAAALADYGAGSLSELDARAEREDRAIADAEAVVRAFAAQRADQERRIAEAKQQIETALVRVQAAGGGSLEERASAYLIAASRHEERRGREASLERGRRELDRIRRPFAEERRLTEELARTEARLRESLSNLAIEPGDLEIARSKYAKMLELADSDRKRTETADRAAAAAEAVLAGETLESLVTHAEDARSRFDEHRTRHGDLPGVPGDREALTQQIAGLEEAIRGQIGGEAGLRTQAEALEASLGDPAELKEQLAVAEAEIDRILTATQAVGIARTVLAEAADELKREFAPHLNAALQRNLERITGGRYSQAFVGGDLSIRVVVPETGEVKSAEELSRATKDQLFLVERLEIARLLAPTKGSAPLLLDDPFAHYDHTRLRHGLEVVADAARERQVILFSEDANLAELAEEVCGTCEVIRLSGPEVPAHA